nr:MAG TPA: hypothetical protein [Caudoviricetes sp.]
MNIFLCAIMVVRNFFLIFASEKKRPNLGRYNIVE